MENEGKTETPVTAAQLEEAHRRRQLVEALAGFPSLRVASQVLGEPAANLCRYRRAWDGTLDSLMPTGSSGRPPVADALSSEEIAVAKTYLLKTESLPLALELLADSSQCSHASRDLLNRFRDTRRYPPSIVRAVRFTEEEWAEFHGRKHAQGTALVTRRGMFGTREDGASIEVFSGDIVEADDVSIDTPYFVTQPDGTVRTGRQVLCYRDLRSGKWLYACAVARDRDSYRAEDILRASRWLVEAHGLPGMFRFERGNWESDAVIGHKVEAGIRWGGLAQLVPIQTMFSSNGKANIEGGFRMLHKLLGLSGIRIGKTRSEYEQATADMLAVNSGKRDPRDCGFIPWEKLLAEFDAAFTRLNGRVRFDQHSAEKIAPDDQWWRDMQARKGKRLPACPPELFYHFAPIKRQVSIGAVRAGHVQISVEGHAKPFLFRCAGEGIPYLERLHKVWVSFDPLDAAAGAEIFNDDASPRNRDGWRPRQFLFRAPLAEDRAQYDHRPAGTRGSDESAAARKIRKAQIRAVGTSIGMFGTGSRRVEIAGDGEGNAARIERGAMARSQAASTTPDAPTVQTPRIPRARPAPVIVEDLDLTTRETAPALENLDMPAAAFAAPRPHFPPPASPAPPASILIEELDLR
ncbi:hypothetical protein [Geminisphaera colitermitum]|uniref:hypothetical protein n=1 Tax=Geminisphaera colitermitum TaxID=1148786 RepID=UPI000158CA87|nr:hypothetical protein [Geminisphaera colitermitum]